MNLKQKSDFEMSEKRKRPKKYSKKLRSEKFTKMRGKTLVINSEVKETKSCSEIKPEYKAEQQILKSVFAEAANSAFPQHTTFVRGVHLTLNLLNDKNFVETIKKQNLNKARDIIAGKIAGEMFFFIREDLIESKNVLIDDLKKYYEEFKEEPKYDA